MKIQTERTLYLIGGANGAGKSTVESMVFGESGITFVNADNIASENHLVPSSTETGKILFEELDLVFSAHASFVYETTLSGKYYNKLMRRAKQEGYSIEFLYVFLPSVETNIKRVKKRYEQGGHNVKEEVVRRRCKKSFANFDDACKKSNSWHVYDNSDTEHKCRLVATGTGDAVNIVDEELYARFMKCKERAVAEHLADVEQARVERLERAAKNLSK